MTRRPNYNQQRAERDRAARAKSAEKMNALRDRAEQRKSGREAEASDTLGESGPVADGPATKASSD
ncbi:hypothetical protein ACFQU1_24805 [Chelatococcus sp. GCM10030263]|uniref:hypothetical protein n=1 Tax=Chelatococcus sp. GCM10030263 TaxID=3273387 RepID=UPI00361BD51F